MRLKYLILADLAAYHRISVRDLSGTKGLARFMKAYFDPDFRVVVWFRLISCLVYTRFKWLAILLHYRVKKVFTVDISPWAFIAPGLRLQHAFNIVVGPNARIGRFCILFNGVTLGKSRPGRPTGPMPTISRFCTLGTGCKLLGDVRIPKNSIVGANTVVRPNAPQTKQIVSLNDIVEIELRESISKSLAILKK